MRDSHRARLTRLTRRELIGKLGVGAAFGLLATRQATPLALAQAGGWQSLRGANVAFPKGAIVRTILKDISPETLSSGATQIHEHIGSRYAPTPPLGPSDIPPGPVAPASEAEYLDLIVDELKMSRADGLSCLVDAATDRRDDQQIANLKQMASRSGVHIVVAGGYYQDLALAKYAPRIVQSSEDELVAEFVRDASQQRWGAFGEIASSQPMQAEERKVLRAIGKAHVRTGLPVFTHTPHESCPSCALEQLDLFESMGVDVHHLCIGHLSAIKPGAEPLGQTAKAIAKRGAYLGFDTVGHMMGRSMIPEAHKVRYILAVLEAGFEDHILLSPDSTPGPQFKANWGNGFSSVLVQFIPKLRYAGVKEATLRKILIDNPRRFLSFVPRQST
jgi:phosphotriesterase-related protein